MPFLLGFLACEKVIIEDSTRKATVINILHEVSIPVLRGVEVPPGTLAPLTWNAFTIWYMAPDDGVNWFEQLVVLAGEAGEWLIQSAPIRFQMTHAVMRGASPFSSIPVYREAKCTLKLLRRNLGPMPDHPSTPAPNWEEVMTYPIDIRHTYYPS